MTTGLASGVGNAPPGIAPSILSVDPLNLARDIARILPSKPDYLHIDVMDGHFVPNLTIGPAFVKALKAMTDVPLDVHLMIDNPAQQVDWYLDAGADVLTVHIECFGVASGAAKTQGSSISIEQVADTGALVAVLKRIREHGARAGLSLNPGTPIELLDPFYAYLDWVLVMSVHPGFAAQSFIAEALDKIAYAKAFAARANATILIAVDGGINQQTIEPAARAGIDVFVAGNAVFAHDDPVVQIAKLRQAAAEAAN